MRRPLAALALIGVLFAATPSEATEPYVYQPVPETAFSHIPTPAPTVTPSPEPAFSKPSLKPQNPKPKVEVEYRRPSRAEVKAYAKRKVGATQFRCLDKLWTRESGWRWNAENRSSGAYGIPQALPGSKMRRAGADWRTNPLTQVRWGLGYIKARYGTPCKAWQHSQDVGWY